MKDLSVNIFDNVFISLICKQKKHPRIFKFLERFSFYSKFQIFILEIIPVR